MYVVMDTASNNVLGEFGDKAAAEACRIDLVSSSPSLAEFIEVVDLDRAVAAHRRAMKQSASAGATTTA